MRELSWRSLHRGRWLVLRFARLDLDTQTVADLTGYATADRLLRRLRARLALVDDHAPHELWRWANRLPPATGSPRTEPSSGYGFPILCDDHHDLAQRLGLCGRGEAVPYCAQVAIDPDNIVRIEQVDTLAARGLDVAPVLRCLAALRVKGRCEG